jgi:hypothetical protein
MRRLVVSLLVALGLAAATLGPAAPASASTCAITNPYNGGSTSGVQTVRVQSNGLAEGCALIVISHTQPWPAVAPFWFTWYAQETIDPYYPDHVGCVKVQYRKAFGPWINTPYPQGYDCNSADYTYTSGYMLIDPSFGGNGYDPNFQVRIQLANGAVGSLTEWHTFP